MSSDPTDPDRAESLSDDLRGLTTSLRSLAPTPPALNSDQLMFRAGQASAPRGWAWPIATAVSTLAACILGVLLLHRPEPSMTERIVYVPVPESAPEKPAPTLPSTSPTEEPPEWLAPSRYRRIEEQILRRDLDGLPAAAPSQAVRPSGESYQMLLRSF